MQAGKCLHNRFTLATLLQYRDQALNGGQGAGVELVGTCV